jgi:tRNA A-37 threonylcarbamoyl transferase component Bud32
MDEERALRPGDRLDRYELLAPIASGGMASVWLAQLRGKRGFEKLFAIKTIKADLTDDPRFQEMFLDEARIASGIHHPNVAQILDLGEQDDLLYIVMEWVDGDSLAHIRRAALKQDKGLPLDFVLRVVADACAGLHAAHELSDVHGANLGVVHRDVSPHNIIVSSAGSVKVIDFGVAKAKNRRAGDTSTGVIKGKIRFMAPEQVQGHPVDRRADLWAVGVCLYQLVSGELPFDNDSDIDVVRRLMGDEPPPRPSGAIPEAIEEILAHSLVRDPDERFATAAAMQRAIEAAIDELGLRATNDDVAAFVRRAVPELERKRRETVTKAIEAARAREAGAAAKGGGSERAPDDEALAATVMAASSASGGGAKSVPAPSAATQARVNVAGDNEGKTAVIPKKKNGPRAAKRARKPREAPRSNDESKETLVGAALAEPAPPPKTGRVVVGAAAAAALAGIAWFGWPGGSRLAAWLSPERVPEPPALAAPVPAPAPAPVVRAVATATPGMPTGAPSTSAALAATRPSAAPNGAPSSGPSAAPSGSAGRALHDGGARSRPGRRPRHPSGETPEPRPEPEDPMDNGPYE